MADLRSNFWARIDWISLGAYLILVFLGWISIYSATYEEGQEFGKGEEDTHCAATDLGLQSC